MPHPQRRTIDFQLSTRSTSAVTDWPSRLTCLADRKSATLRATKRGKEFKRRGSHPTLFLTIQGEPIAPDTLTEYGRRYLKSAGIDKPGACHIYRHSMTTQMHENGADLSMIQQILGHAKSDNKKIYARTSLRQLLAIHDRTHPASRDHDDE